MTLCPNGKCQREPSNLEKGYNCECDDGLLSCNRTNPCLNNPCLNNSTCSSKENGYSCECLASYTGKHCEYPLIEMLKWSEWGKWSECHLDERENLCLEVSKRDCVNGFNRECRGATKRKRICTHHSHDSANACQSNEQYRNKIFSDFFVINEYITNLTNQEKKYGK